MDMGTWANRPLGTMGWCALLVMSPFAASAEERASASADDRAAVTYRVMAYNVASAAGVPFGEKQIGQMADTIIDHAVDVAGFTEMETGTAWHDGRDHVAELCVALADRGYPMHVFKWPVFRLQQGWFTPALLSRYPIEDSSYECVDSPFSNRWCIGQVTVNVAEDTPVRVMMTHMWPAGDARPYFEKFMEIAARFDGPATIMGDFNLTPDSPLYPIIGEAGFTNGCEAVHGRRCPTVQGMAGVSGPLPLGGQIDYVFGNAEIEFVDSYVGHYSLSDHWPVIAEVRVKANGAMIASTLPDESATRCEAAALRARAAYHYRRHDYPAAAEAYRTWEEAADSPEDAGFAGYSAGMMYLLNEDHDAAQAEFKRVIETYAGSEWSARSHYRLAFMAEDVQAWAEAIAHFEAYLSGYYAHIHTDVKAPLMRITARRIATCRKKLGEEATPHQVMNELAAREPSSMRARAAAFELAMNTHKAGDQATAVKYIVQADPHPLGAWPSVTGPVAEMFLEAGEIDRANEFYAHFLRHFDDELVARVRRGRWAKRTRPESLAYSVRKLSGVNVDGSLEEWFATPTVVLEGRDHVYLKDPRDVIVARADVRVGYDDAFLYFGVTLPDDSHVNTYDGADIWQGDCLQVAIDPAADATAAYNEDDVEFGVALTESGTVTHVWVDAMERDWEALKAAATHRKGQTAYELAVPRNLLLKEGKPSTRMGLNVLIGVTDERGRQGWIDWTPGIGEEKSPKLYPVLTLE